MIDTKNLKLTTVTSETEEIKKIDKLLNEKLKAYNVEKIGPYPDNEKIAFLYHDSKDNLIAGLYAFWLRYMSVIYIDILWVDEAYRHQGLGSKLLKTVETWARDKNVMYTKVDSDTFQAPAFYLKNGYEVVAKLPLKITGLSDQYDYLLIKYL